MAVLFRCPGWVTDHLAMTTNTSTAPPGWHPDPSNPDGGGLRWWDGSAWTAHTHQVATSAPTASATPVAATPVASQAAAWPGGSATITPNYGPAGYGSGTYAPAKLSFAKSNTQSLTAIGVVAVYIVLAMTTHFVLIGILPVLMSVRAIKAKERLAPAAVAAAIIAVLVAFAALR